MCVCVCGNSSCKILWHEQFQWGNQRQKNVFFECEPHSSTSPRRGAGKVGQGRGTRETAREFVANFLGISADCANAPGSLIHRRCWSFSTFYIFADSLAIWQIYYIYFICVSRCGKMFQIIFVKYTCIIQIYF